MSSAGWNAAAPLSPGPSSSCGSRGKAEGVPEGFWGEKKKPRRYHKNPSTACTSGDLQPYPNDTRPRLPGSLTQALLQFHVLLCWLKMNPSVSGHALLLSKAAVSHWLLALPLWPPAQGLQPLGERWQLPTAPSNAVQHQLLLWKSGLAPAQGDASHARGWKPQNPGQKLPLKSWSQGTGWGWLPAIPR